MLVRAAARSYVYLPRFFAGFYLIANGAYLFGDSFVRAGDARELIAHGTPPWVLIACGLPLIAASLSLWNGLGPRFGLRAAEGRVDRRAAWGMTVALLCLIVLEISLFGR